MALRASPDIIYQLDDEDATSDNFTNITTDHTAHAVTKFVLTGGDINRARVLEEDLPHGAAFPEQADTGTFEMVEFTFGGFYRDDAGGLAAQLQSWFNTPGKAQPRWFRKIYDGLAAAPSKFTLMQLRIRSFNRTGESKQNQRFEATLVSHGRIYEDATPA